MTMIQTGLAGLKTAQTGLASVSHNISNVNTPGYSRQVTVQTANMPQFVGGNYIGQGSSVDATLRQYNNFLDLQAREAQTQSSYLDMLNSQLGSVDQMFSDATAGLSPALGDFFKSVGAVAASPADGAARQTFVSSSEVMAGRFRELSGQLEALRVGLNEQVTSSVQAINAAAGQIADLNDRIVLASGGGRQPPNDLLDQRDSLIRDLAKEIRVTASPLGNGAVGVTLSNGQPVVLNGITFPLTAELNPGDGMNMTVGSASGGVFLPFSESMLSGGRLGAVFAFRSQTLDVAQNALGRIAGALATTLNAQHAVGQDRNGALGGALFSFSGGLSLSDTRNTGTGMLNVAVTDYNALSTSDYRVDFDGTNYKVRRLSDNNLQSFSSLPQTIDGFSLSLASGTPAAGDSFTIMPARNAAATLTTLIADPAKIAAGLPVRGAAGAANAGSGVLRVAGVTPPAGANLTQPVAITFTSATTFNVTGTGTGNPTGLTYTPGMTLSYNGWSATLNGTPKSGDAFSVGANVNGTGDNGNMLALGAMSSTRILGGGTLSAGEAYAQVVSDVGNRARSAATGAKAQDVVLASAQAAQQQLSGVNLDEEAADLLKYQQAYQAASRVIATASSLFDEILAIVR